MKGATMHSKEQFPNKSWSHKEPDYYQKQAPQLTPKQIWDLKKEQEHKYLTKEELQKKKRFTPDPATVEAELRREEELWQS